MNLLEILSFAQDMNSEIRKKAESYLKDLEVQNPIKFYTDLVQIFGKESIPQDLRGLAGLIIKNKIDSLTTEDLSKKKELDFKEKFFRKEIKNTFLGVFDSPSKIARRTSSQILAKISKLEILSGGGKQIFENFWNILSEKKGKNFQSSILETIEFICQEFQAPFFAKILSLFSGDVFKIISSFLNQNIKNESEIQLPYLNTLSAAIFLLKNILEEETSQQFIFSIILKKLENGEEEIRRISFEILDKIAQDFYKILDIYVPTIFHYTVQALKGDQDIVTLQAIELWSTIADNEFELTTDSIQAVYEGRNPLEYSKHFILQTSTILSSLLLELIKKKNIEYQMEEWNCTTAAGNCLNLISQVAPGEIIPNVISFIEARLGSLNSLDDRGSVSLVFVAILDGLGSKLMYNHIIKTLPSWLYYLEKENSNIQPMISWTIGKISHICPYTLRTTLGKVVPLTIGKLNSSKNMYKTCWSLNKIFQSFGKEGTLDWCIEGVFISFLNFIVYQKPEDTVTDELFEIFCSIILNSSTRNKIRISSLLPTLYVKIRETLNFQESEGTVKIQSHLFRVIGCMIQKLGKKTNKNFIEGVIRIILLISSSNKGKNSSWTLEEELLVCIGTIIQKESRGVIFHLDKLIPFLLKNVENEENFQVCSLALGILGDVCRGAELNFSPFVFNTGVIIFSLFQNSRINQELKPLILVCMGDLALSHKSFWEKFSDDLVKIFKDTALTLEKFSNSDEFENRDWVLNMKESLIEGMIGIIQSFQNETNGKNNNEIFKSLLWIPGFLKNVLYNSRKSRTSEACLGLIWDLSLNFPQFRKNSVSQSWVRQILFEAKTNKIGKIKTLGSWIYEMMLN